jgi:hypothetical protein
MKGWDYHLLRIWRWVRISVIIVELLAMLSVPLIFVLIFRILELFRRRPSYDLHPRPA